MGSFILSCESTVDFSYSYMAGRDISVLFYSYCIDGREYEDDMGRTPGKLAELRDRLKTVVPTTSQLNEYTYEEYFEDLLKRGDVLHIAFGSGMTGAVQNAFRAAERLREKYPERRLTVVDSLCSSTGYGMLVDMAADMRDGGSTIDEVADRITEIRHRIHHQFYSTDLSYFRKSGRISGASAVIGTALGICPLMRLDDKGRIIVFGKIRGKRNAIAETVRQMSLHAEGGTDYRGKCYICHSGSPEEAEQTKVAVEAAFPQLKGAIRIWEIGTIITCHCGPGTVAVFFVGDKRPPKE